MSATMFLAICILGCDFLLYVLYQWNYGERRGGLSRRPRALRTIVEQQNAEPFLAASRKRTAGPKGNLRVIRGRASVRETGAYLGLGEGRLGEARFGEARAYRRIAGSFAHAK